MGLIAEFQHNSPDMPLTDAVAAVPDVTLYIDRILVVDPDRPVVLCRVIGDEERFSAALADDPTVEMAETIDAGGDEDAMYRIRLRNPPLPIYRKYVELGTTPLGGIVTVDGWWARARFPDREALAEYRAFCTERGSDFKLERLTRESASDEPPFGLTREQYEALVEARDAGYFAVPRAASTEEVGDRLGISAPSASERLRRGIDRLLENAL
ncbi:Bacterio-opsin activator HTH domain protein [Natrinema pellirubrum DSM 15624]|uniref:Bacterio-opsin activator HTH domain protein n=1 Tax=Natrinema pellirubrum (strain DSM 15624 / CIP 106293 / JCM 10476 / NCIMB 786 / 157) TaxID=797303 RepID=L0JJR7_NATP1|nr:helix-turn-helix domain-containing protein [Natrinema pellirubrum]AGB31083.1 putative DNA binding protein [Natrinema pellirubrum DSM 15624]ELY81077.1 Bacterio-opsin activator HTH domain protein [Natrinema pellirubrum DSM 15624]ELZ13016.1 Bacterio-opsin activator HTH domain protein [Natrinema thermotolerans DSM 11552]